MEALAGTALTGHNERNLTVSAGRSDVLARMPAGAAVGLAEQIKRQGYGVMCDLFSPKQIAEARKQAKVTLASTGGSYAGLDSNASLHGAILHDLSASVTLASICRDLFAQTCGDAAPDVTLRQTFRCLSGMAGRRHNLYFHFDSYALTLIVPVDIPETGQAGDLLLWPNARSVPGSYLVNVVEKFVTDRRLVQWLIARRARRSGALVRVRLVPGNLYVFDGYRTLHANEAVDVGALRATLVLHCIDPHMNAKLKRLFGRVRRALSNKSRATGANRYQALS